MKILLPIILLVKLPDYYTGIDENGKAYMIVFVWGEVENPGVLKVPYKTDLLFIISKAGGFKKTADLNKIWIKHFDHNRRIKVKLKNFLTGKDTSLPEIKPGDIIYVEANSWSKLKRKIEPVYFISNIIGTLIGVANLILILTK